MELNINELTKALGKLIVTNYENEKVGIPATAISLVGPAGIAKTSAVKQLENTPIGSADGTVKVVKVPMANIEESGD